VIRDYVHENECVLREIYFGGALLSGLVILSSVPSNPNIDNSSGAINPLFMRHCKYCFE
jgi:hypothetical protein